MDLILLAKIVRMEADIRTAQTELDDVGMMVENKRGTPIPNPLLSVIDTLERRQLAVIRSSFSTKLLPISEHSMAWQS